MQSSKIENFFYYNKWKLVAGFFAALLLIFLMKDILAPSPDIRILVLGKIRVEDADKLEALVESGVDEAKIVSVDQISYLGTDVLLTNERKELVLTAAGEIDIFILDKEKFAKYAAGGLFLDLDQYAGELGVDIGEESDFILKAGDDPAQHLYAIDISGGSMREELEINGEELIAAVNAESERAELALEVLKFLAR